MEKLSQEASQKLSDLAESELTETTSADLNEARNEMQNQNQSSASQSAGEASSGLEDMLDIGQEILLFQASQLYLVLLKIPKETTILY